MGSRLILAMSDADSSYGDKVLEIFRAEGLDHIKECEVVSGKNRILQCLEGRQDVAVVIVSQYQGQERLEPEDFDLFSTAGSSGERLVIPILRKEEKGSEYLANICSLGIYLALFENDAKISRVAELIKDGRPKAKAREYYGISSVQVTRAAQAPPMMEPKTVSAEEPPSGKFRKKERKKKEPKTKAKKEYPQIDCGVISTNVGVGSTFQSIMIASSVAECNHGLKVAVVEFDDAEQNMKTLCMQALNRANVHGVNSFSVGAVDYFFSVPFQYFMQEYRGNYDVVIYDFGCCDDPTIEALVLPMDRKFVVADVNEWHRGELAEFVHEVGALDRRKEFVYLFPCMNNQIVADSIGMLNGAAGFAVPYEGSPFAPSQKTAKLLNSLLYGSARAGKYPKPLPLSRRAAKTARMQGGSSGRQPLIIGLLLLLLLLVGLNGHLKYQNLMDRANEKIAQANENIRALNAYIEENDQVSAEAEQTVLKLNQDVQAGTVITEDMVTEEVILIDTAPELLLKKDDLGEMAVALSLPKDAVLFDYMLAEVILEAPPLTDIPEAMPEGGAE